MKQLITLIAVFFCLNASAQVAQKINRDTTKVTITYTESGVTHTVAGYMVIHWVQNAVAKEFLDEKKNRISCSCDIKWVKR